ncbi:MAG: hypothetical protein K2Q01_02540, partial [Rickettsiales bacterium]|nr:hypothetical protein [Rickettsiales bacterium]
QFIATIETVIKPPIVVKSIEWVADDKSLNAQGSPKTTAVLALQFPTVPDLETWRAVSKKILTDLKVVLPSFDITFSKLPQRFSETDKMDISFDSAKPAPPPPTTKESSDVVLMIKEL